MTLPGRMPLRGRLHVSNQTLREIYAIFAEMGFQIYRSPEVEDDETNFGLLNMPPHHPAQIVGHVSHDKTWRPAAHAHVARADSRHAKTLSPANPRDSARHVLSLRGHYDA